MFAATSAKFSTAITSLHFCYGYPTRFFKIATTSPLRKFHFIFFHNIAEDPNFQFLNIFWKVPIVSTSINRNTHRICTYLLKNFWSYRSQYQISTYIYSKIFMVPMSSEHSGSINKLINSYIQIQYIFRQHLLQFRHILMQNFDVLSKCWNAIICIKANACCLPSPAGVHLMHTYNSWRWLHFAGLPWHYVEGIKFAKGKFYKRNQTINRLPSNKL